MLRVERTFTDHSSPATEQMRIRPRDLKTDTLDPSAEPVYVNLSILKVPLFVF